MATVSVFRVYIRHDREVTPIFLDLPDSDTQTHVPRELFLEPVEDHSAVVQLMVEDFSAFVCFATILIRYPLEVALLLTSYCDLVKDRGDNSKSDEETEDYSLRVEEFKERWYPYLPICINHTPKSYKCQVLNKAQGYGFY